jgi:hypothetical protein|tara:strand:- start:1231 stop:1548 length:318 start_codon:yes stop_codon:yes gene_type:complete
MFITKTSMITGQQNTIWIEGLTASMLKEWEDGALVQDALKGIPQEMREFVMTGITPDEWSKTFSDVDEGDVEWDDEDDSDISQEDIVAAAKKFVEWLEDEKNFQN